MKPKEKQRLLRLRKLYKELSEYEDMDLHDENVLLDIKGIVEDLNREGIKITFEDALWRLRHKGEDEEEDMD